MNSGLLAALSRVVGRQWVRHRRAELVTYAMDGLPTHESVPGVVVMPASPDQVREILRLLHVVRVPFVARGAGTGLSGGALADPDTVLIALTRMNQILRIDPTQRTSDSTSLQDSPLSQSILMPLRRRLPTERP
jgi:glycolate oxidase